MPKPFAGDLGVNAGGQQMRGVGVAQIVEPNARQLLDGKQSDPFVRDASRLQRAAIDLCHHE